MAQEEKTGVPEKHSLQPPTSVALGTVSEGWAGKTQIAQSYNSWVFLGISPLIVVSAELNLYYS